MVATFYCHCLEGARNGNGDVASPMTVESSNHLHTQRFLYTANLTLPLPHPSANIICGLSPTKHLSNSTWSVSRHSISLSGASKWIISPHSSLSLSLSVCLGGQFLLSFAPWCVSRSQKFQLNIPTLFCQSPKVLFILQLLQHNSWYRWHVINSVSYTESKIGVLGLVKIFWFHSSALPGQGRVKRKNNSKSDPYTPTPKLIEFQDNEVYLIKLFSHLMVS